MRASFQNSSRAPSSASLGLEVGELRIDAGPFNPSHPSTRAQLVAQLGAGNNATIEEMQGFRGGLNEGIWFLRDHVREQEFVLKLVRGHRIDPNLPTEAENLQKICREHPNVFADATIAFPIRLLNVIGQDGAKRYDLIVMQKARGLRLAEVIARKWYTGQAPQLMRILEKVGSCLADFHGRYGGKQHGDFQPSNILYDEERDAVVMIDIGGMGVPTTDTDAEHFAKTLRLLAESYGARLVAEGLPCFERGLARGSC